MGCKDRVVALQIGYQFSATAGHLSNISYWNFLNSVFLRLDHDSVSYLASTATNDLVEAQYQANLLCESAEAHRHATGTNHNIYRLEAAAAWFQISPISAQSACVSSEMPKIGSIESTHFSRFDHDQIYT